MNKEALKFNEDNKDKPYCKGRVYVGNGRGGAHWEDCKSKHKCSKHDAWIKAGKSILLLHDEQVNIHCCSVKVFRQCFLYNI